MNLKSILKSASILLAGTAAAVLIPVSVQAGGLVSGGAARELNTSASTLSETVSSSSARAITAQITDPSEVIEEEYLNLSIAMFETSPKYCNVRAEAFEFPACNYNQNDIKVSVKIQCSILARETSRYSREMYLDCIYLRPRRTIEN